MRSEGGALYAAVLAPEELYGAGMHYYLEATDGVGNTSTDPAGAPSDYLKFDLVD